MKKGNQAIKIIVLVFAFIFVILITGIIVSGATVMHYKKQIPTVLMKQNVSIQKGDTIYLENVAEVSSNMTGYIMGAVWADGSEYTDEPNKEELEFDNESGHQITVNKSGKLRVYVTAWGSNHEFTGGDTIVTVTE